MSDDDKPVTMSSNNTVEIKIVENSSKIIEHTTEEMPLSGKLSKNASSARIVEKKITAMYKEDKARSHMNLEDEFY